MSDNPAADQAAYCRQRAAEARARAEAMTDFEGRRTMLEMAEKWEALAKSVEPSSKES